MSEPARPGEYETLKTETVYEGQVITLVKDTSLIYVLALNDLLRAARGIVQRDFTITPFVVAAGFYLVMTLVLTWIFQYLEKRHAKYDA